jgi:Putative hemolysin
MIDVERALQGKFPSFQQKSPWVKKLTISVLKKLMSENEINQFIHKNQHLTGFCFIDAVLAYFNFDYSVAKRGRENIPATGRLIIVANHPLGALDGLALLKLVSEVRRDVKIIANDVLMNFKALDELFLPVDNIGQSTQKSSIKEILSCLESEQAVIIFPAGEVSRMKPSGVRDGKWSNGFLSFARKTQSPILPVHVGARNSLLFYASSMFYKPLSALLLSHEMFNKHSKKIAFRIGNPIPYHVIEALTLSRKETVKLIRREVYRVGRGASTLLGGYQTIIPPQDRHLLQQELKHATLLNETADNKKIYLFEYKADSAVMSEVGRLRELAFREVGLGTGTPCDLDHYDPYYKHIILWDENELEIAGAYRLAETKQLLKPNNKKRLYSQELFDYNLASIAPYLEQGVELGRSFINPKYRGGRSLDHLWFGVAIYLQCYTDARYLFGPVSLSGRYPELAKALIVNFYSRYYADEENLAAPKTPYKISTAVQEKVDKIFKWQDRDADFKTMRKQLSIIGVTLPALYKQYSALCEEGGVRAISFNLDKEFAHSVVAFMMADIRKIKKSKRLRYSIKKSQCDECDRKKLKKTA